MVKLNRIYTRTGDAGTTGLVDGSRVSKADPRIAAIGDVDEANSAIGVAIATLDGGGAVRADLLRFQNDLFDLGADLATPDGIDGALRVTAGQVAAVERAIDRLNANLDPLTSFILPGGSEVAARVHIARAAVRRAERAACALHAAEAVNPAALAYLNRLSDLLFVLGRAINSNGMADVLWVPGKNR